MSSYKRWPKGSWMRLTSADTLKALMRQRNFSMERLGRYSGCSKSFISHLCAGRKSTCTPQLAARIAEALEVPLELLFVFNESADCGRNVRTGPKEHATA
ncbi:helix-turn-helix DNA binding domain protein [Gordonia phage Fairfaxidum]|uniref:Helix-turn-helix DNA binding protein n=2 Tax=root TaxID=1 RepID=A0A4D6T6H4_9CAUD|nr:helix-turn-helix DNA binding domain protein [Gordonia phage Fairfaxidum]QCG77628.1 helix-turn-helix DNA binding protein [Gordonia phage Fairfaxidum]